MPLSRSIRALGLAGIALALSSLPASAEWTSASSLSSGLDNKAGFFDGLNFETIWFSCESIEPGLLSVIFSGFDPSLSKDVDHTVVVTVDGTAYLQATRGDENAMKGDIDLVRTAPYAELQPLIEALKKGKSVEISSPSGRTTIPLKGSGKALTALQAGCGG